MRILLLLLFLLATPVHADNRVCLASLVWHEARGEPQSAQLKVVVEPTLNRSADVLLAGYAAPKSKVSTSKLDVCKVVYAKGQYQWTKWSKLDQSSQEGWDEAMRLAKTILARKFYVVTRTRFFNNKKLGKRYPTAVKPVVIENMMAY